MRQDLETLVENVIEWAEARKLLDSDSFYHQMAQYTKTVEEVAELGTAIIQDDAAEIRDAIGDIIVTLIVQAKVQGTSLVECLDCAYRQISQRTGTTVNGIFIKDE